MADSSRFPIKGAAMNHDRVGYLIILLTTTKWSDNFSPAFIQDSFVLLTAFKKFRHWV